MTCFSRRLIDCWNACWCCGIPKAVNRLDWQFETSRCRSQKDFLNAAFFKDVQIDMLKEEEYAAIASHNDWGVVVWAETCFEILLEVFYFQPVISLRKQNLFLIFPPCRSNFSSIHWASCVAIMECDRKGKFYWCWETIVPWRTQTFWKKNRKT